MGRFALIPAAYVVFRRHREGRREVLLQYRRGTGFMDEHWACGAAGHVEAGESVVRAAVREAREELGVVIDADDLVPLTVVHRRHEDDSPVNQRVDFFFAVDSWKGEPRTVEPDKSADLAWFPLDALPAPVVPHELRVLRGLADGDLALLCTVGFPHDEGRTCFT
ncbi:MAG: NUDIX domain-containing protein [Dermatophilaceae bacterium]